MESLFSFRWYRDRVGYRLVRLPTKSSHAHWTESCVGWKSPAKSRRQGDLQFTTGALHGERRLARPGLYVAGHKQALYRKDKTDCETTAELFQPFNSNQVVSLNVMRMDDTPESWLDFSNRYGMLAGDVAGERWHLYWKNGRHYIASVEHEAEWHSLRNTLYKIFCYYPAILNNDEKFLSQAVEWESENVVRQGAIKLGRTKIQPAIAMRGDHNFNAHYFDMMTPYDLRMPAAFVLRDSVNRYLDRAVSLELEFDPETFLFSGNPRYGSLGAAIVAEAVEFITGRLEAKQCLVCSSWFRVGSNKKRRDKLFCSAACKMRDYRGRKQRTAT